MISKSWVFDQDYSTIHAIYSYRANLKSNHKVVIYLLSLGHYCRRYILLDSVVTHMVQSEPCIFWHYRIWPAWKKLPQ